MGVRQVSTQSEFGVPDDVRLEELVAFVGIKTAGSVLGHALVGVLPENRGFGGRGDGVQIDDPEVAFVPVEHFRPVAAPLRGSCPG